MAKTKISEYDSNPSNNTDLDSINLSEGVMTPSSLNDAHRMQMAHLKDFSDGTSGIDVLNLQDDDGSASIKIQAPSVVTTTTTLTLPDGDGSSNQVLSTNGSGTLSWYTIPTPTETIEMVSGMLMPFAGSSAPTGWLLCYGQAVSRTTYSDLFSAIGTTYGSGNGSTTFNLPDLRGRVIAGQDDMGGSSANRLTNQTGGLNGDTLGATGGAETHTLTEAQMPAHTHGAGSLKGTTYGGPDNIYTGYNTSTGNNAGSAPSLTGSTGSTGGDGAHNNVQPTIILNYIIKT